MGVLEIFVGVLEVFDQCIGDFGSVSWRYLIGVMEVFERCP